MRAAVIDYGAGNLRSVERALARAGFDTALVTEPAGLEGAEVAVLPGVGAFGPAAGRLRDAGFFTALPQLAARGRWLLGLCLGMQLMFDGSDEDGRHEGLRLLRGRVTRLPGGQKVPHMGWNELEIASASPIFADVKSGEHAYFVHSYYAAAEADDVLAWTEYGIRLPAIVGRERVLGLQFHPEKSADVGARLLRGFAALIAASREAA
jgi:glutamine amidotransferase